MSDVRIRAGSTTEEMHDERRAATEGLAAQLRAGGLSVEVQIIERIPGRYGLSLVEWTAIFIGEAVAQSLIGAVVNDVYDATKRALRARREKRKEDSGSAGRHLGFTIYGPDGEVLSQWDSRDDE